MTGIKRIHYCDDFKFDFKRVDVDGNAVAVPTHQWHAVIHTPATEFRAWQDDKGIVGAKLIDEYTIRFILNAHGLQPGAVVVEFVEHIPDEDFPDGSRRVHRTYNTSIELVADSEASAPDGPVVTLMLPYIYESAYTAAVSAGYKGTQNEYMALVSMLPDAVETAIKIQGSADSLADSAEQIGSAIETLGATTDAINQGANVIKDNADVLQESADKVSESATKVEQAVESLDATKQAFEMLSSEWISGRTKIADALTRKYSPTEASESFDAMAQKVMDLPLAVEGQEGIIDHTANGIIDGYDLLNELHKHQRQDYPYCCGVEFVPYLYKTVVLSGAEAYLCSDGFFTTEQEVEHTFAEDNKLSHYIIYYYTYPTYQVPTTINPASHLIAYNGQPRFNLSNYYCPIVRSYTNERYSVGSSDITANNFSDIADIMLSGIETFGGVIGVTSSNSNILSVNLPHAKNLVSGGYVARQLYHLKNLCLASLEQVNGGYVAYGCAALTTLELPNLTELNGGYVVYVCDALTTLELPNLTEVNGGYIVFNTGPQIIRLPKLKYCNGNIIHQYQIKGAEMAHIYIPQISGTIYWGSVSGSNFNIAVHLGSQQEDNIKIATSNNNANRFTIVTVELGFRSSLDLHFWTYISAETLQGIIDNLADNNDYEPLTLTLGTTLKNKLSEEYIAIATAKNYNIA